MNVVPSINRVSAVKGTIAHFLRDPGQTNDLSALEYFEEGLLVVENGYITKLGPAQDLIPSLPPGTNITHYGL